jgi:hypothetical protein
MGVALAGCARFRTASGPVTINLSPPWKVGQKYVIVADSTTEVESTLSTESASLGAPTVTDKDTKTELHLEAEGVAEEVYPNGMPRKVAMVVRLLRISVNEQPVPGVSALGSHLDSEVDDLGRKHTTIDGLIIGGQPVTQEQEKEIIQLLDPMIVLTTGKYTDDQEFGAPGPVAVGATWPANAAAIADDSRSAFPGMTGLHGQMQLEKVTGTGPDLVATVSGLITYEGVKLPLEQPYMITGPTQCRTEISGDFPVQTKGRYRLTEKTVFDCQGESLNPDNGQITKLDRVITAKVSYEMTFH